MTAALCLLALAAVVLPADLDPPEARIDFPLPSALTDAETIRVRGSASDPDGVAAVRVNGVRASTVDEFATWWAEVPLEVAVNEIVVATVDALGNEDPRAAATKVRRDAALLNGAGSLALDPHGRRAFVLDSERHPTNIWLPRVMAVELETGDVSIVSSAEVGNGPFPHPPEKVSPVLGELEYDSGGNRLLTIHGDVGELFAIDPLTGDRMIVSGPTVGSGPTLVDALLLVVMEPARRAVVLRGSGTVKRLIEVDLITGERKLLKQFQSGGSYWTTRGLARLPDTDLLMYGADDKLLAVSISPGSVLTVSWPELGLDRPWKSLACVALDGRGRAWVGTNPYPGFDDDWKPRVFAVDLETGHYDTVLRRPLGGLPAYMDVDLDPRGERLYVADGLNAAVLSMDLADGQTRVVARSAIGHGDTLGIHGGIGLALGREGSLYCVDRERGSVHAVDLDSGERRPITSTDLGSGPELQLPIDLAIDASSTEERLVVFDRGLAGLVAVDLENGDRSMISGPTVGTGPKFEPHPYLSDLGPWVACLDDRAFVLDFGGTSFLEDRLIEVDLATGNRKVLSVSGTGTGPMLIYSTDMTLDVQGHRVVVSGIAGGGDLVAVDLDTGQRSLLSGSSLGQGPALGHVRNLVWDEIGHRVLSLGWSKGVIAIDGTTGDRTQIASWDPSLDPGFHSTRGATLLRRDLAGPALLLTTDHDLSAIGLLDLALDPTTACVPASRVVLSR